MASTGAKELDAKAVDKTSFFARSLFLLLIVLKTG